MVGQRIEVLGPPPPAVYAPPVGSGFVVCDGATYNVANYPVFSAQVGVAPDATTFQVPSIPPYEQVVADGTGAQGRRRDGLYADRAELGAARRLRRN